VNHVFSSSFSVEIQNWRLAFGKKNARFPFFIQWARGFFFRSLYSIFSRHA
jgi:hypothetical protein